MGREGASARRATRYLPLVLAAILAGCGSSDPASSHSLTGVNAAARELLADAEAGRYHEACEAFTATALAAFAKASEGCPGTLLRANQFLVKTLTQRFKAIQQEGQIVGDTVLYGGSVQARYEHGRWRFENDVW